MKEKAEAYLKKLLNRKLYWEFKIQHAVWVDNGIGGCVNKEKALLITKYKIEAIQYLLKN